MQPSLIGIEKNNDDDGDDDDGWTIDGWIGQLVAVFCGEPLYTFAGAFGNKQSS